jgi:acyl-CoA synthetase (AMP-forming)/AMP-acid ligase II
MINNDEEIAPNNITRFNDLVSNTSGHINVESSTEFDDPINIQFTSGTTGHPKGATLTHHNIIHNAYFVGKRALEGLDLSQLRVCVPNPLYHCFGSVLGSILVALNRGTLVLPAPIYNPIETLKAIHNFK